MLPCMCCSKQSELCQLYEDVQPILFALKPKDIKCAVVTQADADDAHAVEAALERLKPPALGLISYQVCYSDSFAMWQMSHATMNSSRGRL